MRNSLLWDLWENYNILEPCGLTTLIKVDSNRVYRNIIQQFKKENWIDFNNEYDFSSENMNEGVYNAFDLLNTMLKYLYQVDRKTVDSIVNDAMINRWKHSLGQQDIAIIYFLSDLNNDKFNDMLLNASKDLEDPFLFILMIERYKKTDNKEFNKSLRVIIEDVIKTNPWNDFDLDRVKKSLKELP